jgi:hypothetical protein
MSKTVLTPEMEAIIRRDRLKMPGTDIAKSIGVSKSVVIKWLRCNGLSVPKHLVNQWRQEKLSAATTSDEQTDRYLTENYLTVPIKTMAANIGRSPTFVRTRLRQLALIVPTEVAEKNRLLSRYKPGQAAANKGKPMPAHVYEKVRSTMFKKGSTPANTKYDGHERVSVDGYVEVRVSKGKYVHKHKLMWEQAHGPVPKGFVITFKDGNRLHTELANYEMISMKENMLRNTIQRFPDELRSTIRLVNKLKKIIDAKRQN